MAEPEPRRLAHEGSPVVGRVVARTNLMPHPPWLLPQLASKPTF